MTLRKMHRGYHVVIDTREQATTEPHAPCAVQGCPVHASCGTLCEPHVHAFEAWLARYPRLRVHLAATAPRWLDAARLVAIDQWLATL